MSVRMEIETKTKDGDDVGDYGVEDETRAHRELENGRRRRARCGGEGKGE